MRACEQRICEAIARGRVLRFAYDGHERVVEPHGHGWTTSGAEVVSGYQTSGGSVGGRVPGWKMFHVEKVRELRVAEPFDGPRPDYDPTKLRIGVRCCQLRSWTGEMGREQEPEELTGVTGRQV